MVESSIEFYLLFFSNSYRMRIPMLYIFTALSISRATHHAINNRHSYYMDIIY